MNGSPQTPRLFVLGLDGSPLPLLRRLMASGDMPNLARIFETGSAIEMNSSLPDVSAVAWTSINTGKNPGKHGIYGFVDRRPGTDGIEIMTSAHVRAQTMWEMVSEQGGHAVALNVPLSYPPQHIRGVVVSDFLAPALQKAVYPPQALPVLETMGYRIDTDPWAARQSLDTFVKDFEVTADRRAEAVLHFVRNEPWSMFMVVFMETDRLHHFMWQYMEENDPTYGPKFVDAYRKIDGHVGRIVDSLNEEDQLIVLSDHGFTTLKKEFFLNVWLEREGFLAFAPGVERGLASLAPSSRAYALDPGRIYVSPRDRPESRLSRASEETLSELADGLLALRDDDGSAIVRAVYRADDIYSGPMRDRAPDLLVMPHDGYDIKGTFEAETLTGRGKLVGMHKYDNATLFLRGRRFLVDHASVRDVMPTAFHLMGWQAPDDVDGRVVAA